MKRVGVGTVLVFVGGYLALGCGTPAQAPTDVMAQVRAELAHTIDPVGEATLESATIVPAAPRSIDTELEAPPVLRTWGGGDGVDADLLENPYTRERYEAARP